MDITRLASPVYKVVTCCLGVSTHQGLIHSSKGNPIRHPSLLPHTLRQHRLNPLQRPSPRQWAHLCLLSIKVGDHHSPPSDQSRLFLSRQVRPSVHFLRQPTIHGNVPCLPYRAPQPPYPLSLRFPRCTTPVIYPINRSFQSSCTTRRKRTNTPY